jgi:small subunit ribosomal protein S9
MAEEQKDQTTPEATSDEQAPQTETAVAEAPAEETPETQTRPIKLPTPPADRHWFWGTGRRKKSIARVRIRPGDGKFLVNNRQMDEFFTEERDRNDVVAPLQVTKMTGSWDVHCNVRGGGSTGQAGAILLGLARALIEAVPDIEHDLRVHGLMTRDARMKERKKPGQPGARRRFQFSKR